MAGARSSVPVTPTLRLGDRVLVTYRTSGGPAHWVGSVVEVGDDGLARISDGHRVHTAAVRGAAYIQQVFAAEHDRPADGLSQPPVVTDHTVTASEVVLTA